MSHKVSQLMSAGARSQTQSGFRDHETTFLTYNNCKAIKLFQNLFNDHFAMSLTIIIEKMLPTVSNLLINHRLVKIGDQNTR